MESSSRFLHTSTFLDSNSFMNVGPDYIYHFKMQETGPCKKMK